MVNANHVNMENKDSKPDIIGFAMKKRELYLLEKLQRGSLNRSEIRELMQIHGKSHSQNYVPTQEMVAKAFKTSTKTVQRWIKKGAPGQSSRGYDLVEIAKWRYGKDDRSANNPYMDPDVGLFIFKVMYAATSNVAGELEQVIHHMIKVLAGLIADKKTETLSVLLQYLNFKYATCLKKTREHYWNAYKIIEINLNEYNAD